MLGLYAMTLTSRVFILSTVTSNNQNKTAFEAFMTLLPAHERVALSQEQNVVLIIEKYFGTRLLSLHTSVGAMQLLREARLRPRETTLVRIEEKYRYTLNGDFEGGDRDASSGSIFIRAYETETLTSRILKFTATNAEAIFEYQIHTHLGFPSAADSLTTRIVPVLCQIQDIGGKFGFSMPSFISSLHKINLTRRASPGLEPALFKVVGEMRTALSFIHGRNVFHNDLKPQNILLNASGDAFLADFVKNRTQNERQKRPPWV